MPAPDADLQIVRILERAGAFRRGIVVMNLPSQPAFLPQLKRPPGEQPARRLV